MSLLIHRGNGFFVYFQRLAITPEGTESCLAVKAARCLLEKWRSCFVAQVQTMIHVVHAAGSELAEEAVEEEGEEQEEDMDTKKAAKKPESVPTGKSKGKKGSINARWEAVLPPCKICEHRSMTVWCFIDLAVDMQGS